MAPWTGRGRPPAGYVSKRPAEDWLRDTLEQERWAAGYLAARQAGDWPRGSVNTVETGATFADAAAELLHCGVLPSRADQAVRSLDVAGVRSGVSRWREGSVDGAGAARPIGQGASGGRTAAPDDGAQLDDCLSSGDGRSVKCPGSGLDLIEEQSDMDRSIMGGALAATAAASATLAMLAPQASATTKNVNFLGTWKASNNQPFTIKKENLKTGACSGTTSLSKIGPYKLVACHVKGNHYAFTITYGTGYKS